MVRAAALDEGVLREILQLVEGRVVVQVANLQIILEAEDFIGLEQGGIVLQSGTTDRSFKLIVTLTDGTSWQ